MNCVQIIGRLTADVELKQLQGEKSVINFTVAVNRRVSKDAEPKADFIRCVAWDKTAEMIASHFSKGKRIALTGSIRTSKYEKEDGTTIFLTEILTENVTFVENKEN